MGSAHGSAEDCFHCGLPLRGEVFQVLIDAATRSTCCRGCQAVAQAIADAGLAAYYRTRSALPAKPGDTREPPQGLRLYDLPDVQRSFVSCPANAPHIRQVALLLEGITCSACAWLIEQRLAATPGVREVTVNYAARRARIQWDAREVQLSTILGAIEALGYSAQPYDAARADAALVRERRAMLWRLFVAGFGMMQVMMYAVPVYLGEGAMTADIESLMRIASLLLTAPVVAWAATPFYRGALRELRRRRLGMDVPIAAAILIAFGASAAATLSGSGEVYFDSVTMFVFLLLAARYLELCARMRAVDEQERLAKLAPAFAERLDRFPHPGTQERVAAATLERGDFVLVRPGATVPADCVVADGASAMDESLLTGESRPVAKAPGDRLIGGTINGGGVLVARVERVRQESVLSGIVRLMDRAQAEKPRIALAADKAAAVLAIMVLALAVLAAAAWYTVDPARIIWITIAILVASCPCALSLATPTALSAAIGALYQRGVLVTRGHALETLAQATHFVFDKTGTLTLGELTLVGVLPLGARSREACLHIAAAMEAHSEHPIGRAIVAAAKGATAAAEHVVNVPGRGIEALVEGVRTRIGSPEFAGELWSLPAPELLSLVSAEVTTVALADENGWIALVTLEDALRRDARSLVSDLQAQGTTVCLLSGDRDARVQQLARTLGIGMACGDATPERKVDIVRKLQEQGAVVAMIGDGVNDAPVLARAQVSVAMASGADLAQSAADIVLLGGRLGALRTARRHACDMLRVVRQNLVWATVYNCVALPLAAAGLVTPLAAAAGMSISSLVVVTSALRLLQTTARG